MSVSQDRVDQWIPRIQDKIDARPISETLFEFKELFDPEEWAEFTDKGRYARHVTKPFKKRICGFSGAQNPKITNVQVRGVRENGRERMFQRIAGQSDPNFEEDM